MKKKTKTTERPSLTIPPGARFDEVLALAIEAVKAGGSTGLWCPCCGGVMAEYDRPFNSLMARCVIAFTRWDREEPGAWHRIERFALELNKGKQPGDHGKLIPYGLLEKPDAERDDGSPKVGLYRITEKGKLFARGRETVPQRCVIYMNQVLRIYGKQVTIRECLGKKFNYRELIGDPRPDGEQRPLL